MSTEDTELLKEFAVESQEHLADIENQLLTLESQGDNMDVALVNTVFRAIHSIKGAAGFMGLDTLGGLAHRAEEVLNKLRNKDLRPTSVVINTLLKAADRLKELIDQIESSNEADVSTHLVALEQILSGEVTAEVVAPVSAAAQVPSEKAAPKKAGQKSAKAKAETAPKAKASRKAKVASSSEATVEPVDESAPVAEAVVALAPIPSAVLGEALREFLVESFDNLEQIERDLLILERQPDSESVLNSVFRNMHTVKGSAGFLGYAKLEKLTHTAENLLGAVRSGSFPFDSSISEILLKSIDGIRKILHSIEGQGNEGSDDFSSLIERIAATQREKSGNKSGSSSKAESAKAPAQPVLTESKTPVVATPQHVASVAPVEKQAATPAPAAKVTTPAVPRVSLPQPIALFESTLPCSTN